MLKKIRKEQKTKKEEEEMTRWDEGMEEKEGEANEIRGRYRRRDFLFLTSGSLKICVYLAQR